MYRLTEHVHEYEPGASETSVAESEQAPPFWHGIDAQTSGGTTVPLPATTHTVPVGSSIVPGPQVTPPPGDAGRRRLRERRLADADERLDQRRSRPERLLAVRPEWQHPPGAARVAGARRRARRAARARGAAAAALEVERLRAVRQLALGGERRRRLQRPVAAAVQAERGAQGHRVVVVFYARLAQAIELRPGRRREQRDGEQQPPGGAADPVHSARRGS